MQAMIRQPPEKYGQPQTRWTLRTMLICCPWLRLTTEPGLSQLLHRLGIHWKRAQDHIHSPDAAYFDKLRYIDQQLQLARDDPEHYAFLFLDEITVYRQPTLAFAYERAGHRQPLAHRSCRSNTAHRILGAVDALTGQVFYMHRSHITVSVLTQFFEKVCRQYAGRKVFIALDNWPVHFHRDLLAALEPQKWPWPPPKPPNWSTTPRKKTERKDLPIQLLGLPTYAPWTNPMEKVWRCLKQAVVHLHLFSNDTGALYQRCARYLDQFIDGSQELLNTIGLGTPGNLWTGWLHKMSEA